MKAFLEYMGIQLAAEGLAAATIVGAARRRALHACLNSLTGQERAA